MSDFRVEVEIGQFCTCTLKSMEYNPHLRLNSQNFCTLPEIGVKKHDGDVRFQEVEMSHVCACALKNVKYNPNLW